MRRRILAVDDDLAFLAALEEALGREGFEVVGVGDAAAAVAAVGREHWDALCVDLGLPGVDGLKLLRTLRAQGWEGPVVVVSGRAEVMDRVMALDLGADDYVTKPFSPAELAARLRAVLRRVGQERVRIGSCEVDLLARVVYRGQEAITLSPVAAAVLRRLLGAEGVAVSREALYRAARPGRRFGSRRLVDNAVVELRRALEVDPASPRHVVTVRGVGYRLER